MKNWVFLLLLLLPGTSAAQSLRLGTGAAPADRSRGFLAYPVEALQSIGAKVDGDARGARVILFSDTISFTAGSAFFRARGGAQQMVSPAYVLRDKLLVPAQVFSEWLPRTYGTQLAYRAGVLETTRLASAETRTAPAASARPQTQPQSRPQTPPQTQPLPQRPVATRPAVTQPRIVVIDAGHGGRDPGAHGPNGLLEKSTALAIATRLSGFLKERGYEVRMTRASDTLIALADRPHFANQWKGERPAAVFVSIHANSGASAASGFETYFLSEARTEDERRVAEMENAAVRFEDKPAGPAPELDLIVNGLKNDYFQRASNDLAEVIQEHLAGVHPGPNRGVKQAGFRVLVGALMPAVLVEVGFISNREESRLLGTSVFQQKVAYSLAQAVDKYFSTHEHLWVGQ